MKICKRLKTIAADRHGGISPMLAGVVIVIVLLSAAIYKALSLITVATGVRDSVQSSTIETITKNYYNAYDGLRCGNSGTYSLSNNGWVNCIDSGDIGTELDNLLGLQNENGEHIKSTDDGTQYSISNIAVTVKNTPFADSSPNLKINVSYTLNMNIGIANMNVPISISQSVSAGFKPKF